MENGPLAGLKIIEFAGLGPGQFTGMMLADMGADVIRIDRAGGTTTPVSIPREFDLLGRGRRSVALNLKDPDAVELVLDLSSKADAIIEGYRPGVMERLGLGPDEMHRRNPKLVFGRMTGWGQTGPYAQLAGHDLNYIAISGALHAVGTKDRPVPPLNLAGDFGGGAMYLAFGLLAGILSARVTGEGQVVDCAMSDGAASLMGPIYSMFASGIWKDERQANMLDGAAPFYNCYLCADGKWISVAPIEPAFYAILLDRLGNPPGLENPVASRWNDIETELAKLFAARTRDEWCEILGDTDACFAPVLSLAEAPFDPHNQARETFVVRDGFAQPAPAPRFSRTPGRIGRDAPHVGEHNEEVLRDWGVRASSTAQ